MGTNDQLDRDGPARTKGAPVSLLVEPVHGLENLEELEHALEVAEHSILPEVLLDQLPQGLWFVGVDDTLGEELMEPNLVNTNIRVTIYRNETLEKVLNLFW